MMDYGLSDAEERAVFGHDDDPPDTKVLEPCGDCEEERDLPDGIEIYVYDRKVCRGCLDDYLHDAAHKDGNPPEGTAYLGGHRA